MIKEKDFIRIAVWAIATTSYKPYHLGDRGKSPGLPNSISDTYYSTEKRWLFPVTIGLTVLLAVVPLFELTREPYKFLAFFIIAGILFVTAAPAFKEQFEGKIHCISAIIADISVYLGWC